MKYYTVIFLLLLSLACSSFSNRDSDPQEEEKLIQLALNSSTIEKLLKKGSEGDYLPVVLITNMLVTESLELSLAGQPVVLVSSLEEAQALGEAFTFLELTALSSNARAARLSFQLDDYKIKVKLKNGEDEWLYASSSSRKKGHFSIDTEI